MCPLGLCPPFYGFYWAGLCSYKSKFYCDVYLKHRLYPPDLGFERLTDLLKIYSKCKNLDFFRMRYFESCATLQSMFTYFAVIKNKETVHVK